MASQYADFFATPEPHHHVSRLLVLSIILVVVGALVWVYSIFFMPSGGDVTTMTPQVRMTRTLSDAERKAVMSEHIPVPLDPSMTDAKRSAIMTASAPPKQPQPTLTDEERVKIMTGSSQ